LDWTSYGIDDLRLCSRLCRVPDDRSLSHLETTEECRWICRHLWVSDPELHLQPIGSTETLTYPVHSIFLSLGEVGPGDNIGLIASKTSATAIRGQYYGIAAALGKIGAFVGTYVFPIIIQNAPNADRAGQDPFYVSSALCIFSAFLAFFLLPHIGQDTITDEDVRFRAYLEEHGWDTSRMGTKEYQEAVASNSTVGAHGMNEKEYGIDGTAARAV